jgi:3-phenylpropionate/trans-cinnamate dioxygenase ferredoxin reductase subunit
MSAEPGIVIVGAGKAGARAIVAAREFGWQGPVTLIGDEKLLPYDRPPLSKSSITSEEEPQPVLLVDQSIVDSLHVDFICGVAAAGIDRRTKQVKLADGREIPYRKLLIATGAYARPLAGAANAITLRDFDESVRLRREFVPGKRVAVIGGGFIGLELASTAAKRGCIVTVIEAQPRILLRGVTERVATVVARKHADAGVEVLTNSRCAAFNPDSVTLTDGRTIPADIVVVGIGAAPRTALAEAAGLVVDNGIACDTYLRTSDPDIYSAGDCCSFPHPLYGNRRIRLESWRAAQDMASVAVQNMLGASIAYEAVPWFWSDQYDQSLQIAGLPDWGARSVFRPLKDGAFVEFHLDDSGRLVGASGIGPGNTVARDIRLAELLIAKRAAPDPAQLADPAVQLRTLLAQYK